MSISGIVVQSDYDNWKVPGVSTSNESAVDPHDETNDQKLITRGIQERLACGVKGTDLAADYTPDPKYQWGGEFHISLPVLAEGEVPAIRTLISELTKLTCNLPD